MDGVSQSVEGVHNQRRYKIVTAGKVAAERRRAHFHRTSDRAEGDTGSAAVGHLLAGSGLDFGDGQIAGSESPAVVVPAEGGQPQLPGLFIRAGKLWLTLWKVALLLPQRVRRIDARRLYRGQDRGQQREEVRGQEHDGPCLGRAVTRLICHSSLSSLNADKPEPNGETGTAKTPRAPRKNLKSSISSWLPPCLQWTEAGLGRPACGVPVAAGSSV